MVLIENFLKWSPVLTAVHWLLVPSVRTSTSLLLLIKYFDEVVDSSV
jgi:hypothetical protein